MRLCKYHEYRRPYSSYHSTACDPKRTYRIASIEQYFQYGIFVHFIMHCVCLLFALVLLFLNLLFIQFISTRPQEQSVIKSVSVSVSSSEPHSSSECASSHQVQVHFYRAMHFSAYARSWDRMLSVRLSVTLVDCDHIGWKSWKLIARTISPTSSLFVAKRRST